MMTCKVIIMAMSMLLLSQFGDAQSSRLYPLDTVIADECYPIEMTCEIVNLSSLSWFFNSAPVGNAAYTHSSSASLPAIIHNSSGVAIKVTDASVTSDQDVFSATSVLTTTTLALSRLRVNNISCGTTTNTSETRFVVLDVQTIPTFTCNVTPSDEALSAAISFTTEYAVEKYRVLVSPDPSNCSSDQVNSNQVYPCSGLNQETLHNFTVSAFPKNCSGQEGDSTSFTITPQDPQISAVVEVLPVYSLQNSSLDEVLVQWTVESQDHISEKCSFSSLNYTATLSSSEGLESQESKICMKDRRCRVRLTTFNTKIDRAYFVTLRVSNGVGQSEVTSEAIGGSFLKVVNASVNSGICATTVYCVFPDKSQGNCSFAYGQDADFSEALVNTSFTLPLLEPDIQYHSMFIITNSTHTIQINETFSGQFAARLSVANKALLAVGVVVFVIASVLSLFLLRLEAKTGYYVYSLVAVVCGVFLLVVCVLMLIVTCAIVLPQKNTCDPSWQTRRDDVIIVAAVFALLAFIVLIVAVALRLWKIYLVRRNSLEAPVPTELDVVNTGSHQSDPNSDRDNKESSVGGTQEAQKPPQAPQDSFYSQDEQALVEQLQASEPSSRGSQLAKSDGSQSEQPQAHTVDGSQEALTVNEQPQTSSQDDQTVAEQPHSSHDSQTAPQAQAKSDDTQDEQTVNIEEPSSPKQTSEKQLEAPAVTTSELERTDVSKLPLDRIKMLSTFRGNANYILAGLLKTSMNADDALEHLEKHNYDYDKAMDEIKRQNQPSKDDDDSPQDDDET